MRRPSARYGGSGHVVGNAVSQPDRPRSVIAIPDTQHGPGRPTYHLEWAGAHIAEKQPDAIVHLGDHADMGCLSTHASRRQLEGQRYREDVQSANDAFAVLDSRIAKAESCTWRPRKIVLGGNHEFRIERTARDSPALAGHIGYHDLDWRGWEFYPFVNDAPDIVDVFGVQFAHYFTGPNSSRALGNAIETRLKALCHPFVCGHTQGLRVGTHISRVAHRGMIWGIQAGSYYPW